MGGVGKINQFNIEPPQILIINKPIIPRNIIQPSLLSKFKGPLFNSPVIEK